MDATKTAHDERDDRGKYNFKQKTVSRAHTHRPAHRYRIANRISTELKFDRAVRFVHQITHCNCDRASTVNTYRPNNGETNTSAQNGQITCTTGTLVSYKRRRPTATIHLHIDSTTFSTIRKMTLHRPNCHSVWHIRHTTTFRHYDS